MSSTQESLLDTLINTAIQDAIVNNIRRGRLSNRYYNRPPEGGYIIDEEYEYVLPDNDDMSSMIFLDVATRFGSPGSDNPLHEYLKNERIKLIKNIKYKKIKIDSVLPDSQCSICIDDFCCGQYYRKLNCNHVFHKKCIDRWFKKDNNNCPMCRSVVICSK